VTSGAPEAGPSRATGVPPLLPVAAAICIAVACALYLWRLHDTPIAIGGDEAFFANHGLAIATTGADLNGRRAPLLIQLDPDIDPGLWYQSMLAYLEALAFTLLPFGEWSARLPVALLAVVNIALTWIVAARYTRQPAAGPVAAMVLALSPIHFFLSRQALDYVCPILFVLLWLGALSRLDRHPRPSMAWLCGVILGAGVFSYVSSWLMMPVYLLCTIGICVTKPRCVRLAAAAIAGFAVPVAALVWWLMAHPDAFNSLVARYAGQSTQLPGLNINGYYRVVDFVTAYWTSWSPAQLFLLGSPNPIIGVRSAGVFVAPVAILFAAGLVAIATPRARHAVLIAGLLTAPLGPVLYGTPGAIQRQLVLLPFVAIVSGSGAACLWSRRAAFARHVTTACVIACPAVFAVAALEVFEGREAYVTRFDPSNFRELTPMIGLLDSELPAPSVVITVGPYDRRGYWRFHTNKLGSVALQQKAVFWERQSLRADAITENSLIVAYSPSDLATELDRGCPRVGRVKGEAEVTIWRASGAGCLAKP
jgi:hypothetical protein